MTQEYLTIPEASEIVNKSLQTLRRAIKANKIKYRRQRTPQGFNYLIAKDSLFDYYNVAKANKANKDDTKVEPAVMEAIPVESSENIPEKTSTKKSDNTPKNNETKAETKISLENKEIKENLNTITKTLEKMIDQHSEERQNFIRLINTLNEKIFSLESQIKLLNAPKKSWYTFWKK